MGGNLHICVYAWLRWAIIIRLQRKRNIDANCAIAIAIAISLDMKIKVITLHWEVNEHRACMLFVAVWSMQLIANTWLLSAFDRMCMEELWSGSISVPIISFTSITDKRIRKNIRNITFFSSTRSKMCMLVWWLREEKNDRKRLGKIVECHSTCECTK